MCFRLFANTLKHYTRCGARTHDPEVKSLMLLPTELSGLGPAVAKKLSGLGPAVAKKLSGF